jgi:hypothetical protein
MGIHGAVAALTMPFVRYRPERCAVDEAIDALCASAKQLSNTLQQNGL